MSYEGNKRSNGMKRSVRINLRREDWKSWKAGGNKDKYLDAKQKA